MIVYHYTNNLTTPISDEEDFIPIALVHKKICNAIWERYEEAILLFNGKTVSVNGMEYWLNQDNKTLNELCKLL